MTIILAQKALQAVLRVGLTQLKIDVEARNLFLKNFDQFDATFKKFNEYAALNNIPIDNFIEPVEEINTFIKKYEVDVKLGFPRTHATMPELTLSLGADGEGGGSIGDIAKETRDEFGRMKVFYSSDKHRTISIHIVDTNPDALEILYQLVDFVLITHRMLLTQMGLNNCRFDAGDVHPNQEGLESGVFLFERIISVTSDVYQEYEAPFYGFTPLPSEVVMGSTLESEPDVDPADLEEEVIVEETPMITEEDGLYTIGDQIPINKELNLLYRGADVAITPTVPVVESLAIKTFDQAIEGDFIFESNSANDYAYFVYPKSLGEVIFKDANENAVPFLRVDLVIETIDYHVYRSTSVFSGTLILTITKI